MQQVNIASVANIALKGITTIASSLLFCAGAKNKFSNPIVNAAQAFSMFTGHIDWLDSDNLGKQMILPMLGTAALTIDDYMMDQGFTSKHHLTDIVSAFLVGNNAANNAVGIYNRLQYQDDKKINKPPVVALLSAALYGLKLCIGGGDAITSLRYQGMKIADHFKMLSTLDSGVNIETIFLGNSLLGFICEPFPILSLMQPVIASVANTIYAVHIASKISIKLDQKYNDVIKSNTQLLKVAANEEYNITLKRFKELSLESTRGIIDLLTQCGDIASVMSTVVSNPMLLHGINALNTFDRLSAITDAMCDKESAKKQLTAQADQHTSSLLTQPRTIIERNGVAYYENISNGLKLQIHNLQASYDALANTSAGMVSVNLLLGMLMAIIANPYITEDLFDEHFLQRMINIEAFGTHMSMNDAKISSIFASVPLINRAFISTSKIIDLFKYVDAIENTSYVHYYKHSSAHGIDLRDIEIVVSSATKLHIDEMFLECGKKYLITGKTGCGKTTLMSALRGLPNFAESIEIDGSISYPVAQGQTKPLVFELTQNDNFPYCVTIIEAILYPMITTEVEHRLYAPIVERIMLEMEGFDADHLSDAAKEYMEFGLLSRLFEFENDIYTTTSGGQKKKMALTGLLVNIMQQSGMFNIYTDNISKGMSHDTALVNARNSVGPVLVLLDEVYNGLDNISKKCVIEVVAKYLPGQAIVVSVEHQPDYSKYDYHLHLNDDSTVNFTNAKTGSNANMCANLLMDLHNKNYHPDTSRGDEHDNKHDPMEFAPLQDSEPCTIFAIEN